MARFDTMQALPLTAAFTVGNGAGMTRTITMLALAAAATLAGCNNEDHTIVAGGPHDPMANQTNTPVELPPAIAASKIYRCKDNSVVYIDWLSDNKSANFRTERTAPPTQLKAPEAGQPMVAEGGYSLEGTAAASSITLARPGGGSQTCRV